MLAALASGITQTQVAKEFGVHPNTVFQLWKTVREDMSPTNPATMDWKASFRTKARMAVERGLDHVQDPIGAGNLAVKVLSGLGDLVTGQRLEVEGGITVSWLPASSGYADAIDVTPQDIVSEHDHHLIDNPDNS